MYKFGVRVINICGNILKISYLLHCTMYYCTIFIVKFSIIMVLYIYTRCVNAEGLNFTVYLSCINLTQNKTLPLKNPMFYLECIILGLFWLFLFQE